MTMMLRSRWRTRGSWRVEAEQGRTKHTHHGRHPRRPRRSFQPPERRKRSPNSLGESQSGGLAASANLTARIVVDDDGGLGALLLAIENDLDSTTSSVAMFLTASFGFLPCLSDTVFFFLMQKLLFSWGLRGLGNGTRPSPSSSGQRNPEARGS